MKLFCFASDSLRNIQLGHDAGYWAVAEVSKRAMRSRITKAETYLKLGSRGLLYCKETQSFTVPFETESAADPLRVERIISPGQAWHLPFAIRPLGDPSKRVS